MVGKLLCFWEGHFLRGELLDFGNVSPYYDKKILSENGLAWWFGLVYGKRNLMKQSMVNWLSVTIRRNPSIVCFSRFQPAPVAKAVIDFVPQKLIHVSDVLFSNFTHTRDLGWTTCKEDGTASTLMYWFTRLFC